MISKFFITRPIFACVISAFIGGILVDALVSADQVLTFREGNGITTVVTANLEHTYYRDLSNVTPRDTADNESDFLLVGTAPGIQVTQLGAPGP